MWHVACDIWPTCLNNQKQCIFFLRRVCFFCVWIFLKINCGYLPTGQQMICVGSGEAISLVCRWNGFLYRFICYGAWPGSQSRQSRYPVYFKEQPVWPLTLWPWCWTFTVSHTIYVKCEYFMNQEVYIRKYTTFYGGINEDDERKAKKIIKYICWLNI